MSQAVPSGHKVLVAHVSPLHVNGHSRCLSTRFNPLREQLYSQIYAACPGTQLATPSHTPICCLLHSSQFPFIGQ